jgi:undecaprenyl diphosphate synthase
MYFMIQSPLHNAGTNKLHIGIIMDGNGRWAQARGLPRIAGHRAGAGAVRRCVEKAPELGIGIMTLYAFSSDNWRRPEREVRGLMRLFQTYLRNETDKCISHGIRIEVIGRRDRLPRILLSEIELAESATKLGDKLHLRIAVDYSSRDSILRAAERLRGAGEVSRETFSKLLSDSNLSIPTPDVDLLIRTGGEQRLSDFLLWESAYAEFFFTKRMWPDFSEADLKEAVEDFQRRDRRFGGLTLVGGR